MTKDSSTDRVIRQNKLIIKEEKFAASRPWGKKGSGKFHIKRRQWPRMQLKELIQSYK